MSKKIGILGSGMVGDALAKGFLACGYSVVRGSRDPKKLSSWKETCGPKAQAVLFEEVSKHADTIVLAVKGSVAEDVLRICKPDALAGKIILDATNPIADVPPQHGVLSFFTTHQLSLMERLQKLAPQAHFVKAFSCVGSAHMFQPSFEQKPSMFICGNSEHAKNVASTILHEFGWEVEDMGTVEAARAIEPLCMLWCLPGFRNNSWNHAFRLMKK